MSAQVSITQLPAAGTITGTEAVPIVQNGVTVRTTTGAIAAAPSQTQTFLTVNREPTLPNSRYVGVTNGLTITDGGAQGLFNIGTTGALLSLVNSGTGFQVKTSSTAIAARSIAVANSGLGITNGDGIAGNPTISLSGPVLNLANASFNGFMVLKTDGSITSTTLVGQTNQIGITNPTGVGNPVISIADNPIIPGTGSMLIPSGTTSQQPSAPQVGMFRYDTTFGAFYGYSGGSWRQFSLSGGVTEIDTGTGLTGGPIFGTGTISIANTTVTAGSYGSTTQVGTFTVNAQGQLTTAASVNISASAIGAVTTINGTANEITSTGTTTVTLSLPTALTFTGKTITGGGFTGGTINNTPIGGSTASTGAFTTLTASVSASVAGDTVTTNTATQTLTNKSMSGSSNTFTNIPNSALVNSSITLGTTNIALGGTSLAPVGLTSVTVTQNPTTGLQLATKSYVDNALAAGIDIHTAVVDDSDTNLASTYVTGGTTPTWTTITTNNTLTTGSAHGLSQWDVIVFGSTTNGLTAGTAYFVESIVSTTAITLSLAYEGAQITSLTNGSGLSITSRANSGVGATLTSTTNGPLVLEGYTAVLNDRILVLGQTSAFQNGCYYVTQVGVASVSPWILTRSTDANKYLPNGGPNYLDQGAYFLVTGGGDSGEAYVCSNIGTIVFGTTNITFGLFSQVQNYTAGTGLSLSGSNVFSISNTAVTAGSYGSATQVGTFTVNAQGQLTLAGNTTVTPAVGSITGLGTGVATALGVNTGSAGAFAILGNAASFSTISASGVITSTVATGTAPFTVASTTQVANLNAASAGNATNTGITLASTGATNYLTFVTATSGNLPQLVNSTITCNAATGAITGGITGGTF